MTERMETKRAVEIIEGFKDRHILVIGDLMMDHYIWGRVARISPEAPVPVVDVIKESMMLGGAANVANNIIGLGAKAYVSGVIGRDDNGRALVHELRQRDIATEGIIVEDARPTTIKTRVIAHSQHVVRFDREDKNNISESTYGLITDYARGLSGEVSAIIISDYCKGVVTKKLVGEILSISKGSGIFTSVDPKIGHFDFYTGVNLITPNLNEAASGSGITITDEETLILAGRTLLQRIGCDIVLITKGEQGMSLFERNGGVSHIPTFAREVYDVTGAGDTVIAAFTLAYVSGATMKEAAIIANHAAGIVVGEVGTAIATREQLLEYLAK